MKKLLFLLLALPLMGNTGCNEVTAGKPTVTGAARVAVQTNPAGLTVEQQNITNRLVADNKPGAIKHLYVISPYSGQVIIYSTVKGKVTSGSKRLRPTMQTGGGEYGASYTRFTAPDGELDNTPEVIGDDGTYGASGDYLYWWDARGIYHQHYLTGGQIVHISDQPLAVRGIIINMESRP